MYRTTRRSLYGDISGVNEPEDYITRRLPEHYKWALDNITDNIVSTVSILADLCGQYGKVENLSDISHPLWREGAGLLLRARQIQKANAGSDIVKTPDLNRDIRLWIGKLQMLPLE